MPNVFSHFKIRYEKLLFFKKSLHFISMTSTVIGNLTWNITLSISKNDSNHEIMTGSIPIKTFFFLISHLARSTSSVSHNWKLKFYWMINNSLICMIGIIAVFFLVSRNHFLYSSINWVQKLKQYFHFF